MGRIKDKHKKRKDSDNHPLSGSFGNTDQTRNDYDIDSDTIKEQQNKK